MAYFKKLLSHDTRVEDEQVESKIFQTPQEYKDFLKTSRSHSEGSGLLRDSYYGMPFQDALELVEKLGFTLIYTEEFTGFRSKETFNVYWRAGVLLTLDSCYEDANQITIYVNWKPNSIEFSWNFVSTGRMTDDNVWAGSWKTIDNLVQTLDDLAYHGEILPTWIERPNLWLLNYSEESQVGRLKLKHGSCEAINDEKISKLHDSVRTAISPS